MVKGMREERSRRKGEKDGKKESRGEGREESNKEMGERKDELTITHTGGRKKGIERESRRKELEEGNDLSTITTLTAVLTPFVVLSPGSGSRWLRRKYCFLSAGAKRCSWSRAVSAL